MKNSLGICVLCPHVGGLRNFEYANQLAGWCRHTTRLTRTPPRQGAKNVRDVTGARLDISGI